MVQLPPGLFYGTSESALGTPDCRVSTTNYVPGERLTAHVHAVPYLSFVRSGSYVERVGKVSIDCAPLTLRFHPASEEHANDFGRAGGRCLNIELGNRWQESLERLPAAHCPPIILEAAPALGIRAVAACHRAHSIEIESVVADLLGVCERATRRHRARERSSRIARVLEFIEANVSCRLSLLDAAAVAGLHPTHFARSFRTHTGSTFSAYVRQRRVARAEALLVDESDATLSTVAAESGFADHAHLTRTFLRANGMAPSRFRAALRWERAQFCG